MCEISNIEYEIIGPRHVNQALDLVASAYQEERAAVSFLPGGGDFTECLRGAIGHLFSCGLGLAAVSGGRLVGFVAGYPVDDLFGKCKGTYTPLFGHGAVKEYRKSIYQELYRQVAHLWVQDERVSHAITLFAHDRETVDTWFWLGFGMRCVDAIRRVETTGVNKSDITIRKAGVEDIPALARLEHETIRHLNSPPMFLARGMEDSVREMTEWLAEDDHHSWLALRGSDPVGYMQIQPDAETFVSEHKDVMNITGAFVLGSERKVGIGALLLGEVQRWMQQQGYKLCGVDFEAFNIEASRFWTKHFTPYTYSLVRRIDERILMYTR